MNLATVATGPFSPTVVHTRLGRLVGHWSGTARTYLDPNDPTAFESAPWKGTIESILGGRFVRFVYASSALGQPIAGELTIAYETGDRRIRLSWIDSLHTSPALLISEGTPLPDDGLAAPLCATGTYFAGADQPRWGWRTELDDAVPDTLTLRMFNVTPAGDETIGVMIELTRTPAT